MHTLSTLFSYGTLIPDVISIIPYEFCLRNLAILKLIRLVHFRGFSKTLLRLTDKVHFAHMPDILTALDCSHLCWRP